MPTDLKMLQACIILVKQNLESSTLFLFYEQKDADSFSVYSFELTENMTFISGPFGETIQEEEESEMGHNGLDTSLNPVIELTPVPQATKMQKNGSKPSTPNKADKPRFDGKSGSDKRKSVNGKKSPAPESPAKVSL